LDRRLSELQTNSGSGVEENIPVLLLGIESKPAILYVAHHFTDIRYNTHTPFGFVCHYSSGFKN
jgi:hypothetical protein